MLYNTNWDVKQDVFSLASLIAWLEKQPSNMQYNCTIPDSCMLGQWLYSMDPNFTGDGTSDDKGSFDYIVFGKQVNLGQFRDVALTWNVGGVGTFGAALERAKAML